MAYPFAFTFMLMEAIAALGVSQEELMEDDDVTGLTDFNDYVSVKSTGRPA